MNILKTKITKIKLANELFPNASGQFMSGFNTRILNGYRSECVDANMRRGFDKANDMICKGEIYETDM